MNVLRASQALIAENALLSQVPNTISEASQARHIIGNGMKTPVKMNSAASQLTENADELLKLVHNNGYKKIEVISGTKIRVIFNDIIGLHRTSSGTLGTPTNTAILHYGSKGAHFVPTTPR
jgi:hypothetical protein